MALAHLGESDRAIEALTQHIEEGGYFDYLPGDPFWAPLAQDDRFTAILENQNLEAAGYRAKVDALIANGDLVLPGQQEYQVSILNGVR